MTTAPSSEGERAGIIEAVRTPLGFFALVVLVIEAILAVIAGIGVGMDRTMTIGGMLFVIVALISIVAYFAYHRPEALFGKREEIKEEIKVEIEPMLAPLRDEIDRLKQENAMLKAETARFTAMRSRVWTYLDAGGSVGIDEILRKLNVTTDPLGKREVEVIIGDLLQENLIRPDTLSVSGNYKVIRTPAGERS